MGSRHLLASMTPRINSRRRVLLNGAWELKTVLVLSVKIHIWHRELGVTRFHPKLLKAHRFKCTARRILLIRIRREVYLVLANMTYRTVMEIKITELLLILLALVTEPIWQTQNKPSTSLVLAIIQTLSLESEMLHNTALELQRSELKWLKLEDGKLRHQALIRPRIISAKKESLWLCRQCTMTNSRVKRTGLFLGQVSMTTAKVQGIWRQRQIGVLVLRSNVQKPNLELRVLPLKLSINLNMTWPKTNLQFLALALTSARVSRVIRGRRVLVTTMSSRQPSQILTDSIWAKNWMFEPRSTCLEVVHTTHCTTQRWRPLKASQWE